MLRTILFAQLAIVGLSLIAGCDRGPDDRPTVFYLRTEYWIDREFDPVYSTRLSRELVRQAILIAARDELGATVIDESLKESLPENARIIELYPVVRRELKGQWNIKVLKGQGGECILEKTYDGPRDASLVLTEILPKLEEDSRGAFRQMLLGVGIKKVSAEVTRPQPPGPEAEKLLEQVDFVAQFGAIRMAHEAIAEQGETPEWLGVLVRGYSNLAMLTEHHWMATTEVFTARAWLYARRLTEKNPDSDFALWHRAYAWAMGGIPKRMQDDVVLLYERYKESLGPGEEPGLMDFPEWIEPVDKYCQFDRAGLRNLADSEKQCAAWAERLLFEVVSIYREQRWMYESARRIVERCPTAYGVYAELFRFGHFLGVTRSAAAWGPMTFAEQVPVSVKNLPDLPETAQKLILEHSRQRESRDRWMGGSIAYPPFSQLPAELAQQLRKETESNAPAELSWSVLALLLEEEQFLQVVHHLLDSRNGVDHSLAAEVDDLLPLVKGHRYEAYVDSFRYHWFRERPMQHRVLAKIEVEDPRRWMTPMFADMFDMSNEYGEQAGRQFMRFSTRDFTLPSLMEHLMRFTIENGPPEDSRVKHMYIGMAYAVAPHCDLWLYFSFSWRDEPYDELVKREAEIKEAPYAWYALGKVYQEAKDFESAERCFTNSLETVPNVSAALELMEVYSEQEKWDKWQKTALEYLETEDLGLEHGLIHDALASGYSKQGKWEEARPYAKEFGGTWSGGGLYRASEVAEGLAQWDESERWIREASLGYAANWGYVWYFWCQRTGRGDIDKARKTARQFFTLRKSRGREDFIRLGAFCLMENDREGCLDAYRKAMEPKPTFSCTFMIAQICRELGDEASRIEALNAMEKSAEANERDAAGEIVDEVGVSIIELYRTGEATPELIAKFEELLPKLIPTTRSAFAYYIGKELDNIGQSELAEVYLRRSMNTVGRDYPCATLAGIELCRRYETSRQDDALDESDIWQPLPEKNGE